MKQQTWFLHTLGLGFFAAIIFLVNQVSQPIWKLARDTFQFKTSLLLQMPLFIAISLAIMLLRLDILLNIINKKEKYKFNWHFIIVYGWPFFIFNFLLPILLFIWPYQVIASLYFGAFQLFGRGFNFITSMLLGFGILLAFEERNSISDL